MVGHLGAQVRLVVLQPDVVTRAILLDEVVFENQRFLLAVRDQHVEVADSLHQETHLEASVAAFAEVGAHARAERFGLADVEDFPRGLSRGPARGRAGAVAQQVDAGLRGHGVELALERGGGGSAARCSRCRLVGIRRRSWRFPRPPRRQTAARSARPRPPPRRPDSSPVNSNAGALRAAPGCPARQLGRKAAPCYRRRRRR